MAETSVSGPWKDALNEGFRRLFSCISGNNEGRTAERFVDMTLRDGEFVLSVNLTGQFLCAREAAREFLRRGRVPEISCAAGFSTNG